MLSVNDIGQNKSTLSGVAKRSETVNDITYIGIAKAGTLESEKGWVIEKVECTDTTSSTTFPNGDAAFNYVWDDRATYTYY